MVCNDILLKKLFNFKRTIINNLHFAMFKVKKNLYLRSGYLFEIRLVEYQYIELTQAVLHYLALSSFITTNKL